MTSFQEADQFLVNRYDVNMKLHGPWNDHGSDHTSELRVHHERSRTSGMDTSVNLKLAQDTYVLKLLQKRTSSSHELTTGLTMSRYPKYSFIFTSSVQYADFPYVASVELKVAEQSMLNIDVDIQNPRTNVYRCNSRVVLRLENSVETVALKARHEKNRRNQWVTKGDLEYKVGKTVSFENVLDFENSKKLFRLKVDTLSLIHI